MTSKTDQAKETVGRIRHSVETKAMYIAIAGLYVLSQAGVFSFEIPASAFVFIFVVAVLIDAYK